MSAERHQQSPASFPPAVEREPRAVDAPRELHTVTVQEFARRLGISRATFDRWRALGELPAAVDLPGRPRWLEAVVDRFIADRSARPRSFFQHARRHARRIA